MHENLYFMGVKVDNIRYRFWRNNDGIEKLDHVEIKAKGVTNWLALKKALYEKFGSGRTASAGKPLHHTYGDSWQGRKTQISSRYNQKTTDIALNFHGIGELYDEKTRLQRKDKQKTEKLIESFKKIEPEGFNGIKWGTNFTELDEKHFGETEPDWLSLELKRVEPENKKLYEIFSALKNYSDRNGDQNYLEIPVDSIKYRFWNNKFFDVMIEIKDLSQWDNLVDAMIKNYGAPHKRSSSLLKWNGDKTYISISSVLDNIRIGIGSIELMIEFVRSVYKQAEAKDDDSNKGKE